MKIAMALSITDLEMICESRICGGVRDVLGDYTATRIQGLKILQGVRIPQAGDGRGGCVALRLVQRAG